MTDPTPGNDSAADTDTVRSTGTLPPTDILTTVGSGGSGASWLAVLGILAGLLAAIFLLGRRRMTQRE